MKGLISASILSAIGWASPAAQAPTCQPSTASNDDINWFTCQIDENVWYGVSYESWPEVSAEEQCYNAGGELISVLDATIDQCAFYVISLTQTANDFILYSGHYQKYLQEWQWCPNYELSQPGVDPCYPDGFQYTNWQLNTTGDCMGGELVDFTQDWTDYTWFKKDCLELRSKFMCRMACAPPTTTEATLPPTTAIAPTTVPPIKKAIAIADATTIYMYDVENGAVNPNNNVRFLYAIPYVTQGQPHMAFNEEKQAIELAGDWSKADNNNHGYFLLDGVWQADDQSLSDGRYHSTMLYCAEVGTVMVGGSGGDGGTDSMVQIYRPTSWSNPSRFWNMPSMNHGRTQHSITYQNGIIYAAGSYRTTIEKIDVSGVTDWSDMDSRSWVLMGDLNTNADRTNLLPFNGFLYFFGDGGTARNSKFLEVYDLTTETSTKIDQAFDSANDCAASVIEGGMINVIGGNDRESPLFGSDTIIEGSPIDQIQFEYITPVNVADALGGQQLAFVTIG